MDLKTVNREVDSLTFTKDTAVYAANLLKASSILKQAYLQGLDIKSVRWLQVRTYTLMRAPDSVLLVYQNWVKSEPNSIEAKFRRGLMYHVLKEEAKASADFEKVKISLMARLKPINKEITNNDLNSLLSLSYDFFLIGEKEMAKKIISDVYKFRPNNARAKNAFLKFSSADRETEISRQVGF